jgi:hypothetical protein
MTVVVEFFNDGTCAPFVEVTGSPSLGCAEPSFGATIFGGGTLACPVAFSATDGGGGSVMVSE